MTESTGYQRRTESTTFIQTSGGLLTEQLVRKLREQDCGESTVNPETFALPGEDSLTESALNDSIAEMWEDLRERWDEVTQDNELFGMDVSEARERWILSLLVSLGFEPAYIQGKLEVDGVTADLSHYGWSHPETIDTGCSMDAALPPIVHSIRPDPHHELGDGDHRGAVGHSKSPHDELQSFLNASEDQQWGVVTDGLKLRILRDFYHTYTRGYVEFDLENIFTNRNFGDFRALYRLCHASRFIPRDSAEDDAETALEQLYQVALSTGVKVGKDLQSNVINAIETLGSGLLNSESRDYLREGGEEEAKEYYQEVLLIIYRLLFLLYAEQRGMMSDRGSLYNEEYSITRLRELAEENRDVNDRHKDLWEGLQVTFTLVEEGSDELGVPCYDGMLFDSDRLDLIDGVECQNDALLDAIRNLTLIETGGPLQRISYADLGVEELGSVYESLLEFTPRFATEVVELEDRVVSRGEFFLDGRGTERKETGSYYTDPGLVQELIQSALMPVFKDRLEEAPDDLEAREEALLNISVCDPACGSAAFLVAANNFLADRLARIRASTDYPSEELIREARRDVLQHCIYAVDLNPMAVELAKVSLWINSAVEDKPLNFLDHHIKCGNSLVGTNSELLKCEFPVDAYETSRGRDWHVGNDIRKRIRGENDQRSKGRSESSLQQWGASQEEYMDIAEQIGSIEENDSADVEKKRDLYEDLRQSDAFQRTKSAYDTWTAAFYWPLDGSANEYPSPSTVEKIRRNLNPTDEALQDMKARALKISQEERFFHWQLEFPEIFSNGGFDCIIGNPPWDSIEMREKEFFAVDAPSISNASTASKRSELIDDLKETQPDLHSRYVERKESIESLTKFVKESGRFPLSSYGIVNTYAPFAEHSLNSLNGKGHAGLITPTAIATGSDTQEFFQFLIDNHRLVSIYDFENVRGIFPDIHRQYRFCLFTVSGESAEIKEATYSFNLQTIEELNNSGRLIELSSEDIELLNPNTKTCPVFENRREAELTINIYQRVGVLKEVDKEEGNPWDVKLTRIFNTSDDSNLFHTQEELRQDGWELSGNRYTKNDESYLPLYEAKLINQYDHRFATFEGVDQEEAEKGNAEKMNDALKDDPHHYTMPRYWLHEKNLEGMNEADWNMGLRDITNATNERTVICSAIPKAPTVNSVNLIKGPNADQALILMAFFNSYSLDFAARQKLSSARLGHYIVRQLPIPNPAYLKNIQYKGTPAREAIEEMSLKLAYTAHDLDGLVEESEFSADPFSFNKPCDRNREDLRFELEALLCHIYGVELSDFETLFDTFKQRKENDLGVHGYYRTREEIKKRYKEMAVDIEVGEARE